MANTMMTYTVTNYSTGAAGGIVDTGAATVTVRQSQAEGFNGDPTVHTFFDVSNNPRVAVAQYTTSAEALVTIYNPNTDPWTQVGDALTWSSLSNIYGLVRIGNYLYAIDYDLARVVEIHASGANIYQQTGAVFNFASALGGLIPSGSHANGVALTVVGSTLYGLFSIVDNPWATNPTYTDSVVVKFTLTQGSSITVAAGDYNANLGKNAFTLIDQGTYFYVASIGGKQTYAAPNATSMIQRLDISGLTNLTTVLDTTALPYNMYDVTFNGGAAYVLAGYYSDSSWTNFVGYMKQYTVGAPFSSPATRDDMTGGVAGYYWGIEYTSENSRLWYARGNAIDLWNPVSTTALVTNSGTALGTATYPIVNDMSYLSSVTLTGAKVRGYRSPMHASRTPHALALRSITQGRPEATEDEIKQANAMVAKAAKAAKKA
jgi:hypothetical protein